jgi:hypothetical protein
VTRHDGIGTSAGRGLAPGKGKGGDDVNWVDANLTRPKNEKIHVVDLVAIMGW